MSNINKHTKLGSKNSMLNVVVDIQGLIGDGDTVTWFILRTFSPASARVAK